MLWCTSQWPRWSSWTIPEQERPHLNARSEDILWELVPSFHHVGFEDGTQVSPQACQQVELSHRSWSHYLKVPKEKFRVKSGRIVWRLGPESQEHKYSIIPWNHQDVFILYCISKPLFRHWLMRIILAGLIHFLSFNNEESKIHSDRIWPWILYFM